MKAVNCIVCGVEFQARTCGKLCSRACRIAQRKAAQDRWVKNNPEKRRLVKQRWSKSNREKMQGYFRRHYASNPQKMIERRQLHYAQETAAVGVIQKLIGRKVRCRDGYIALRILKQLENTYDHAAT